MNEFLSSINILFSEYHFYSIHTFITGQRDMLTYFALSHVGIFLHLAENRNLDFPLNGMDV